MDKKQNSLKWQFEQLFNSFEKFNNGGCTFDEYLKTNLKIRDEANEMYKSEIETAYQKGIISLSNRTPQEYYEQTFNK